MPPPASALITLTAGPGSALSNFAPGKTATAAGSLIATDTNASWTLQAADQGSGAGKLVASAIGCAGSDATLVDPLGVGVSSAVGGIVLTPPISLSSTNQTVASATNQALLTPTTFTTSYSQLLPASEVLRSGCVYSITVTYTLQ